MTGKAENLTCVHGVRRARRLAATLVAVAALVGCGGGGGTSADSANSDATTTAATLSKADYLAQANALCKTMNDSEKAIQDPGTDVQQHIIAIDKGNAIVSDTLTQLRALPVPSGDEATLQAIYTNVDTLIEDAAQYSAALRAGDAAKAKTLVAKIRVDQKAANDASNAYGLTVCGS